MSWFGFSALVTVLIAKIQRISLLHLNWNQNSFTSHRLNRVQAEANSWSGSPHGWDTPSHPKLLLLPYILRSKSLRYLLKKLSILPQTPSKPVNSGVLWRDPGDPGPSVTGVLLSWATGLDPGYHPAPKSGFGKSSEWKVLIPFKVSATLWTTKWNKWNILGGERVGKSCSWDLILLVWLLKKESKNAFPQSIQA